MRKFLSMLLTVCLLATMPYAALGDGAEPELIAVQAADGDFEIEASVGEDACLLIDAKEEPQPRAEEEDLPEETLIDLDAEQTEDAAQSAPQEAGMSANSQRTLAVEQGLTMEGDSRTVEWGIDFDLDVTNDELFAGYLQRVFYAGSPQARRTMATTHAGENLTGQNRLVYDALKAMILEVADGRRSSTEFALSVSEICGKTRFTSDELGVEIQGEPTSADYEKMSDAYFNAFDFDIGLVDTALWLDCNYEMYWWRRYGSGLSSSYPRYWIEKSQEDGKLVLCLTDDPIVFKFRVDADYAGEDEYTVDVNLIATAQQAADNARAIVRKYENCSDCAKLFAYVKEICDLVDYNYDAIESTWDKSQDNPWKLIWVFDGDMNTNVVCEGYTHAFQYLCELSRFSSGVRCYIVSGVANGSHAWNIVTMEDGKNYLVDVTWSDSSMEYYTGQGGSLADWLSQECGTLFLCGASSGSVSEGYTIARRKGGNDTFRIYNEQTLAMYPSSVLTLAGSHYTPRGFLKIEGATYYFDEDGHYVTGTHMLNGSYYQFDSQGRLQGAPTGWQTVDGERVFFEDDGSLHTVHTVVVDPAVEPTETTTGLTEGSHCSVCGEVIVEQTVIPKLDPTQQETSGFTYELLDDGSASITECSLTGDIIIPESIDGHVVVNLKEKLFFSNRTITSVSLPATVTYFGESPTDNEWDYVFSYCRNLKSITVAEDNPVFRSVDGVLYSKDMRTLFNYPCARDGSGYVVPDSTTWLCCTSFASAKNLTELYLNSNQIAWATYTFCLDGDLTVYYLNGGRSEARAKYFIDAGYTHDVDATWPTYRGFEGERFVWDDGGQMHAVVTDAALEATCTEAGLTEGKHCSICGEIFVAQQVVLAKGHTPVVDAAVPANCTGTGLTEGKHCSVCGEVLVAQQVVPAKGHMPVVDAAVAATCTEAGLTEGSHCSACGVVFLAQEVVPAKGHRFVVDPAVAATCTEAGLSRGKHCSVCGEVLFWQEVVPAKGHTEVRDEAVEPTCTEAGLTAGSHCSVCGEAIVAQQIVPAKGHTPVVDPAVAATCTRDGKTRGVHCTVCGKVFVEQEPVPAKGHCVVVDPAVEPTATSTGLTEGKHCSVCGEVFVEQKEVPRLAPTGLRLNLKGTVPLTLGNKLKLKATVLPEGVSATLTWKSSKTKVARVNDKGEVEAVGKGTATITVSAAKGVSAKVKVRVVAPEPKKVKLAQGKKKTLKVGQKLSLQAKLTPANAESKLSWSSDNKAVATVSGKGVVKAKGPGVAKITVTTANKKTASIVITVKKK